MYVEFTLAEYLGVFPGLDGRKRESEGHEWGKGRQCVGIVFEAGSLYISLTVLELTLSNRLPSWTPTDSPASASLLSTEIKGAHMDFHGFSPHPRSSG